MAGMGRDTACKNLTQEATKVNIRKTPSGELVLVPEFGPVYLFDGTPLTRSPHTKNWPIVGNAPCLTQWQRDPGKYGPAYIVGQMAYWQDNQILVFTFGGSFLYATAWAKEHHGKIGPFCHLYDDRNTVRSIADTVGGIAW